MTEDTMRPRARHARVARANEVSFTRQLHYEVASVEGRALVTSYIMAVTLGTLWLLLVHILPAAPPAITLLRPEETEPVQVTFYGGAPTAADRAMSTPQPPSPEATHARDTDRQTADAIGAAFGGGTPSAGGAMVGDVSNVLRGVDVASSSGGAGATAQGKAVLAYGHGGQGVSTPGRGGLGAGLDAASASDVGTVSAAAGIGHASVRVDAPRVVHAVDTATPARDVAELGGFVRGHQAQLQFCYEEYGIKANPNLAGTIAVAVSLSTGGAVTNVTITRRTWSGAGSAETESCIRSRISGWTFPASRDSRGTYDFSFVFNK